jgi:hypothetical protein
MKGSNKFLDSCDVATGLRVAMAGGTRPASPHNARTSTLISACSPGCWEEFGWTELAFPALQARFGFLRAGAAVAVIIAVWHLPFFLLPGTHRTASS